MSVNRKTKTITNYRKITEKSAPLACLTLPMEQRQLLKLWKQRMCFSFCDRARALIYILQNQLFALKYTLKPL
jgi:hypothetical protein